MNTWNMDDTEQILKEQLEQEQAAGIPSIPESLKPENIQILLEKRKKTGKRYLLSGGMAAAAAAAVIIFLIQPAARKAATESVSYDNSAIEVTMAAAAYEDTGEAGCGTVCEGALAEEILQVDGSYEAACIEGEYLYLLQKAEQHELYIINLAETSEWRIEFPDIPQEEKIIEIEIKEQEIYFYNKAEKSYAWSLKN